MTPEQLEPVLRGEPRAVREFIRMYGPVLCAVVQRKLFWKLRSGVDDVMQELMLGLFRDSCRVLRAWDRNKGRELKTYLRDFAEKRTIDWLRRQARAGREQATADPILFKKAEAVAGQEESEIPLSGEPLWRQFHDQCSAEDARLLVMVYIRHLPPQQISMELGLSVEAVYQRKHRLKEKLLKMKEELSDKETMGSYNLAGAGRRAARGAR